MNRPLLLSACNALAVAGCALPTAAEKAARLDAGAQRAVASTAPAPPPPVFIPIPVPAPAWAGFLQPPTQIQWMHDPVMPPHLALVPPPMAPISSFIRPAPRRGW